MSIASKQMLIKNLEMSLGDTLTVNQMNAVMIAFANELQGYDVESVQGGDALGFDYLREFLNTKTIEGCSPKTVDRYGYFLTRSLREIDTPIRSITVFHLRQYLMSERERGISDRTLNGYRSIFASFFGWLFNEGLIDKNPCSNLGVIKYTKVVQEALSDVEFERLKESCSTLRDKAIICFLRSTGCRISEVCALNRTDIDYRSLQCKVLGKGGKERVVYLDDITAMNLKKYQRSRADDSVALFAGKGTDRIKPGGIRKMLNEVAGRAGVEHVHPHKFRRTLATNLIDRGMPIQEVARILGHDKIDTTMRYVYIDDTKVKAAYQKYA